MTDRDNGDSPVDKDTDRPGSTVWDALAVGDELPGFSYVLTKEMIDNYRRVVQNPHAVYPTVAGRHPARSFYTRFSGLARVPNMGQESQYFHPPLAGEEISVTTKVVDKYLRRSARYIVIESHATGWQGRPIETSRLIAMLKETGQPSLERVATKWNL